MNAKKLAETVKQLLMPFKGKIKTITTDNGVEFAAHEIISKSLGVPVYFADPYSSWQKGAIENANGLVRQYIPKSAAFSNFSQQKITKFTAKINDTIFARYQYFLVLYPLCENFFDYLREGCLC